MVKINKRLIYKLEGTNLRLSDVCEDLGIDYEDIQGSDIGIKKCVECNFWSKNTTLAIGKRVVCHSCFTK